MWQNCCAHKGEIPESVRCSLPYRRSAESIRGGNLHGARNTREKKNHMNGMVPSKYYTNHEIDALFGPLSLSCTKIKIFLLLEIFLTDRNGRRVPVHRENSVRKKMLLEKNIVRNVLEHQEPLLHGHAEPNNGIGIRTTCSVLFRRRELR